MTRPPLRWRAGTIVVGTVAALAASTVLGACTSEDAPSGVAAGVTLPSQTLALPEGAAPVPTLPTTAAGAPAVGAVTESTVVGAPADSTPAAAGVTSTAVTTTTLLVLAACNLDTVIADIGPAEQGYGFADLRCAADWATIVARTFNPGVSTDELVVLRSRDGRWIVVEAGGDTTCASAGVPAEHAVALGCDRWADVG